MHSRSLLFCAFVVTLACCKPDDTPSSSSVQLNAAKTNAVGGNATPHLREGFTNSLGMKFSATIPGTEVRFCIHETRSQDFATFIADMDRGYAMTGNTAEIWRDYVIKGMPVGRGDGEKVAQSSHPASCVSWEDAVAFCEWLSKRESRSYRLPTDAEWSFAVGLREDPGTPEQLNGKVKDEYPWGGKYVTSAITGNYHDSTAVSKFGKLRDPIEGYRDGFATTAPVMSFTANRYGLYDLGGNVREWCLGCYYEGRDPDGKDRMLTDSRVFRGGSWQESGPRDLLSSFRGHGHPGLRLSSVGFRVVLVDGIGG
jgi:formylglycine-generating enzyme required for sulfatase activity